jgi:hypothetical protein
LVRDQAISGSIARPIAMLSCEADTGEGDLLNLSYRYDNMADILEEISGLGSDWDVVEIAPGDYQFQVAFEQTGRDLTKDNTEGNAPVTFSLENTNLMSLNFVDDRTAEITVVYSVGKLIAGKRDITERVSLYGAHLSSTWNRIEGMVDATTQDNEAARLIAADSYLTDNTQKIEVTFQARQTADCLYGVHWDLGDMVGLYFNNMYYPMRVTQVTVDVTAEGETITPTIVRLPSINNLPGGG